MQRVLTYSYHYITTNNQSLPNTSEQWSVTRMPSLKAHLLECGIRTPKNKNSESETRSSGWLAVSHNDSCFSCTTRLQCEGSRISDSRWEIPICLLSADQAGSTEPSWTKAEHEIASERHVSLRHDDVGQWGQPCPSGGGLPEPGENQVRTSWGRMHKTCKRIY